ncbi:MAG: DEAD/DEAH box helicase, partial [Planctomycetota bacterium]
MRLMTQDPEALFEAVRKACYPATWSRGIELTRADAVVGEGVDEDEAVFRVSTRGGMLCPTVRLFLDDLDWECDCASRENACEHVAAAVIAWRRSHGVGGALPTPKHASGRVGYRLTREGAQLALTRVIVYDGAELPLTATLVAVAEGRVAGPRFLATQADHAVELALGTHRKGPVPAGIMQRVLAQLAQCGDVQLDGSSVRAMREPLLPVAIVRDREPGFVVRVEPEVEITERFSNGAVLCGDTLRAPGDPRLTAREREELRDGRYVSPDSVTGLVTELLPSLERRMRVRIETKRLPETVHEAPRILLDLKRSGDTLSVLPTLVYGDP